ncbi:hypothetical protein [Nocardioides lijunqiniae]|uniref:hypothetical protein n=1 Tax=Nocardioides lijunqiniae TaxID=2760832 RepID=UPI0018779699|nr:hypothetical protein [Nocardioides lijunqiniae]
MILRATSAAFVVVAAVTTYAVLSSGADVVGLVGWLRERGHPVYAAWLGWVVLAPVVLAAAAWATRRTPWPWVVAVTVQLASLVAAQARLGHLVAAWSWALVAVAVGTGLASVVTAVDGRRQTRAELEDVEGVTATPVGD